jgi:hypothetical protein
MHPTRSKNVETDSTYFSGSKNQFESSGDGNIKPHYDIDILHHLARIFVLFYGRRGKMDKRRKPICFKEFGISLESSPKQMQACVEKENPVSTHEVETGFIQET